MIEIAGSIEKAEIMARDLIDQHGDYFLLDLELLLSIQGKDKEAKAINKRIIDKNPNDYRAIFNSAWDLLKEGDLIGGYKALESGRKIGVYAKPDINTTKPQWNGVENIKNKTILFHCECGLGDEIMQVRFVKELKNLGANVVVGCNKSLMSIFNRIPEISAVVDKEVSGSVYHDYWVPSMNAVDIIGIDYNHLSGSPYLTADPRYIKKWSKLIKSDKFKIGIRWAGNICYEQELFRTIPADKLIEATTFDNIQLYSLQRDDDRINLPNHVIDLGDFMNTWEDTAGIMKNLDLIISSCTSIPHFAGALGVQTWVVIAVANYYSWALLKTDYGTPWYDTVKIFKQKKFQDWDYPLNKINERLSKI
jgi:hypothetical protein